MGASDPLLFELLIYLRRHGVPLGIDDYLLLNDAINVGLGVEDIDTLQFTCRLLWAKSPEDQELFDEAFARIVMPRLKSQPRPEIPTPSVSLPSDDHGGSPETRDDVTLPTKMNRREETQVLSEELQQGTVPIDLPMARSQNTASRPGGTYQLTPRLPLAPREMAGIWRHLRRVQREGALVDLDIDGTIDSISRQGFLLQPVLRARRRNRARVLLLIDRSRQMVPFAPLVNALIESVRRGGLLGHTATYYFDGCPRKVLFEAPALYGAQRIEEVLGRYATDGGVVVVGDAGAARRAYSRRQTDCLRAFLQMVRNYTYRYAWINPLPRDRWPTTNATEVASMIPMYPLDREGLIDAVDILRGRPFPPGVSLDVQQ